MSSEVYINHLSDKLLDHKLNVLRQQGKSDIEPPDYCEKTEMWYEQIMDWVNNNPPKDFVKSIDVFQDDYQKIYKIKYSYSEGLTGSTHIAINIFEYFEA